MLKGPFTELEALQFYNITTFTILANAKGAFLLSLRRDFIALRP